MIFKIAEIDEFCRVIRDGVNKRGGTERFFAVLTEDVPGTIDTLLPNFDSQQRFRRLISDESYQAKFVEHVESNEDKEFLKAFLIGWAMWSETFPDEADKIRLNFIPVIEAIDKIPRTINDVFSCFSLIELESLSETFLVKTSFILTAANKEVGGSETFVMAGTLMSFLITIELMLNSLKLRGTEAELFKISGGAGERIVNSVLSELDTIQQSVTQLRGQFENMKAGPVERPSEELRPHAE
jgi:hypothetical protein